MSSASYEGRRARADRTQQRERARLLQGDDQEEEADDERHDEPVEQEDHEERAAHLRDAGCLRGRVGTRQRLEIVAHRVDPLHELVRRHPRHRCHTERVRERRAARRGSRPAPPPPTCRSGRTRWAWPAGWCRVTDRRSGCGTRRARRARRHRGRSPPTRRSRWRRPHRRRWGSGRRRATPARRANASRSR